MTTELNAEALRLLRRRLIDAGNGTVELPAKFVDDLIRALEEKTKKLESYERSVDERLPSIGHEEWAGGCP